MSRLTRVGHLLLWVCVLHRVCTVSCQVRVDAVAGETVLLPCIYSWSDPLPRTASVYWRDKDDKVVLDIVSRAPDLSSQDQKFRGRVLSFPELFDRGNFSISMKNVQQSDSSPYDCHIPAVDFQDRLLLNVSEASTRPAGSSGAAGTHSHLLLILLSLPLSGLSTC